MADAYTSHFSIANIPYGIGSSTAHPTPQAVTRIDDTVIFLSSLSTTPGFTSIHADLTNILAQPTLNSLAALPKPTLLKLRTAIQEAYKSSSHTPHSEPIQNVTLHLPIQIGDFTDYSASANHVLNAGEAILGVRSFPPAFKKYPVGYAGRSSSITVSDISKPVVRPLGQYIEDYAAPVKKIIFGASRALDYELEVGAVIGTPIAPGTLLHAKDADAHIFGLVLVNDWSARDIQGLEMNPLGPFNGKNFRTTISAWVVTLEALEPFKVPAPERLEEVAVFMDDKEAVNYGIELKSTLTRNGAETETCKVGFETMYWTFRHMLAHHTIGGCGLRTGDLVASGTVSGEQSHEHGCLLELTKNGKTPTQLSDGSDLRYLEDGDQVRYTGVVGGQGAGVGFGECVGIIAPAQKF